ncbi:MAG: LacI family DNA-binding transcriptional regulator [Actinomycetota bacterium]|nr:LacI family DNA-binding transcriptional regulator [Actinomycetota bacterium]
MVTIKDIAKKAGVSTATISYVLNNEGKISEETRRRVLKIVDEMNYKRNTIAKSLRTSKTSTIGIVAEDITVFNTSSIINGINKFVEDQGFHIILTNLRLHQRTGLNYSNIKSYMAEISESIDVLLSRQIEGIIYIGVHPRDVTGVVRKTNKPTVYTYCYTSGDDYCVNYDDKLAAYEITNYFIKMGHENIAVISGPADSLATCERLHGYKDALNENNLLYNPDYIESGDWEFESGISAIKKILSKNKKPPTAIFAMNDLMAAGAIEAAFELGYSVPDDFSVIGFDNREFSRFYRPRITTMDLPLNKMGEKSAEILINLINGKKVNKKSYKIRCRLIKRDSVKKIK